MGKAFIATLGVGKGTWGHVSRILSEQEYDKVFLIATEWVKENFKLAKDVEWILINNRAGFEFIKDEIKSKLPDSELAVSLVSGSGKEHMALLTAIKEKSLSYSLVTLTGDGIKYY